MNKLQLMKNDWIREKSLKLNRVVPSRVINLPTSGTAYNQLLSFDLDQVRNHNGLYRMFIKISDIQYTPDQSEPYQFSFENYFAYLIKKVRLRNKKDITLFEHDYRYTLKRIHENEKTFWGELYDDLTSFTETTTAAYVPIFSFLSQKNPLDLRKMEPLELLVDINDLSETFLSGFADPDDYVELVSAKFELVCMFSDTPEKNDLVNIGDLTLYPPLDTKLESTYDVFYERSVDVSASTTTRIKLECPYPVIALHALAQGSNIHTFGKITNAKLVSANETIFDLDSRLIQLEQPMSESTFLSYQFTKGQFIDHLGEKMDGTKESGLIHFADSFYPSYLELTFSESFTGSVVVFYEYVSEIEIKDSFVIRNATGKFKIR